MPSLADHHSNDIVKLLLVGNSSTGKTGALVSLVAAGWKLGIVDTDNGIDVLKYFIQKQCPDRLPNVRFISCRDEYALDPMNQMKVKGQPKAFISAMKATEKWDDGSAPKEWGPDHIYVLDTLSTLGLAAHNWAESVNPGAKEPRTWMNGAQRAIESYIAGITGPQFNTNVIVITHLTDSPEKDALVKKQFPAIIGKALGPHIPKYFNNLILAESDGDGKNVRRKLLTLPTGAVDLKTSAPLQIDGSLPLESGLATIFSTLTGKNK